MATKDKDKKEAAEKVCSNCLTSESVARAVKLLACSRCGLVAYCSRECQRAHWKANHKQYCVAKADRVPQHHEVSDTTKGVSSEVVASVGECSICMDALTAASACTLKCKHVFHASCVAEVQKFGVKQAFPLCRTPLPPGPEKLNAEATLHYMMAARLVARGEASWSTLPAAAQSEFDTALLTWQDASDEGCAESMYSLGTLFWHGYGVAKNEVEAARWYQKAAERGLADAQHDLGWLLENGRGVALSYAKAARWYKKATDQGQVNAQFALASMFNEGRGVEKKYKEGFRCLKRAAEQGHEEAQFHVGVTYEFGRNGVV